MTTTDPPHLRPVAASRRPTKRNTTTTLETRYRDETIRLVIRAWAELNRHTHHHQPVRLTAPGLARALDALLKEY